MNSFVIHLYLFILDYLFYPKNKYIYGLHSFAQWERYTMKLQRVLTRLTKAFSHPFLIFFPPSRCFNHTLHCFWRYSIPPQGIYIMTVARCREPGADAVRGAEQELTSPAGCSLCRRCCCSWHPPCGTKTWQWGHCRTRKSCGPLGWDGGGSEPLQRPSSSMSLLLLYPTLPGMAWKGVTVGGAGRWKVVKTDEGEVKRNKETREEPETDKGAGERSKKRERKSSRERNYIMAITQF